MLHVPPQFLAKTWTFPPPAMLKHTHVEQYGDWHLFWPHFDIKVLSLPGNSPLLCTNGAGVHASESFPLCQRRAAGWKETALLQVQGVLLLALHYIVFQSRQSQYLSNERWAKPAGSRKNWTLLFCSSKAASALPQAAGSGA